MSQVGDENNRLVLPPSVVSKLDVAHLAAEAERLDEALAAAETRAKAGVATSETLTLSDQLRDYLSANQLQIDDRQQRAAILSQLRQLKDSAPVVHMTFATVADQESIAQLVTWLRHEVHPQSLMAVGLQPGLVGGVYVRTPNHVYDLSLRAQLAGARHLLVEAVEAVSGGR